MFLNILVFAFCKVFEGTAEYYVSQESDKVNKMLHVEQQKRSVGSI